MKRFDLRHLKESFCDRMAEIMHQEVAAGEVAIFLFEIGDFSAVQKSADLIKDQGHELLNSLKFSEVDWTLVARRKRD